MGPPYLKFYSFREERRWNQLLGQADGRRRTSWGYCFNDWPVCSPRLQPWPPELEGKKPWFKLRSKQDSPSRPVSGENGNASSIPSRHYLQVQASPSLALAFELRGSSPSPTCYYSQYTQLTDSHVENTIHSFQRARRKGEQISKEEM